MMIQPEVLSPLINLNRLASEVSLPFFKKTLTGSLLNEVIQHHEGQLRKKNFFTKDTMGRLVMKSRVPDKQVTTTVEQLISLLEGARLGRRQFDGSSWRFYWQSGIDPRELRSTIEQMLVDCLKSAA